MKATDTPQFDQKWWNKNKGIHTPETGFGKVLGAFEVAQDQMDYPKQIHALDEIGKKIPEMLKLAAKDDGTVAVLKKYPNLIRDKKAEIVKKQDAEKAKAAAAATAAAAAAKQPAKPPAALPPQKMQPLEKLWSRDFGLEVSQKLPWLQMKGYIVELKVNGDGLDIMAKEDGGATAALMIKDAQEICKKYVEQFVKSLELKAAAKSVTVPDLQKQALEMFKALHPKLVAEVKEIPKHRWEKFVTDKPLWRSYKIEAGVGIGIGTLQIAAGAVSIAAAVPTMGATLGLAVVASARGLYSTITQIANVIRSVEDDQKELARSVQNLTKAYLDGKKKATLRLQAQEVGTTILKGLLGADPPYVESLSKCNAAYERWRPKVASLRIDHAKGLKASLTLMQDVDKLEAEMKKSQTPQAVVIFGKMKKLREQTNKGLDLVHDLGSRIAKAEEAEPKLSEAIEELNKATPNYVKVFTILFPAAVSIGLAAGAGGVELHHAEAGLDMAKAAVGLSEEVLDAIREAAAQAAGA